MVDYPDFQRPINIERQTVGVWGARDWYSKEGYERAWLYNTGIVPAGTSAGANLYTVATGESLYITDTGIGGEIKSYGIIRIQAGDLIYHAFSSSFDFHPHPFSIPRKLEAGDTLRIEWENRDSIDGEIIFFIRGFIVI